MAENAAGLRIGDLVTFKNLKTEEVLGAEGILLEDLMISEDISVRCFVMIS